MLYKMFKTNPRTVRGTDFTWCNTCNDELVKPQYNQCSGDIKKHHFPWGKSTNHKSFNLESKNKMGSCDLFKKFHLRKGHYDEYEPKYKSINVNEHRYDDNNYSKNNSNFYPTLN